VGGRSARAVLRLDSRHHLDFHWSALVSSYILGPDGNGLALRCVGFVGCPGAGNLVNSATANHLSANKEILNICIIRSLNAMHMLTLVSQMDGESRSFLSSRVALSMGTHPNEHCSHARWIGGP
jgi:hypothetical protein